MKALTIWQPWASLIMIGAKPYEWRRWKAPRACVGQRIVIHAGARRMNHGEIVGLIFDCRAELRQIEVGVAVDQPTAMNVRQALEFLEPLERGGRSLPLAAGLGTATLGEPRIASELGFPCDSTRVEDQNWGWPMLDIEAFAEPVPMRGSQGIWNWPDAQQAVQECLL